MPATREYITRLNGNLSSGLYNRDLGAESSGSSAIKLVNNRLELPIGRHHSFIRRDAAHIIKYIDETPSKHRDGDCHDRSHGDHQFLPNSHMQITPGSPGKFLMAAFVRHHAQKVTTEI